MPLPALVLNNLVTIRGSGPLAGSSSPKGGGKKRAGGPVSGSLAFAMQSQNLLHWCWAAVGVSVATFYNPATVWTRQCDLASSELAQTCCPPGINAAVCDVPWYLDRTLLRVGHLHSWSGVAATIARIKTEIGAGRPLAARIGWPSGFGHFVVVSGFSTAGGNMVTVDDPLYGRSTITLATCQTAYGGTGTWTHTYVTRP